MRMFAAVAFLIAVTSSSAHAQWQVSQLAPVTEYRSVHAPSDSVLWAGGRAGIIARSIDGRTWTADSVPGAAGLFFIGIWAADADTAVALGTGFESSAAAIYRTTDGGATWMRTYRDDRQGIFLDALAFWDNGRGLAFGDPLDGTFVVLATDDGGRSWRQLSGAVLPAPLPGEAGFAASGQALVTMPGGHAWIGTGGGPRARVLHTHDYGATWEVVDTPLPGGTGAGIFGLAFRDSLNGIAVGGDHTQRTAPSMNVLRTADGGRTWELVGSTQPAGVRYGVAVVPNATSHTYVAVGPPGSGITHDAGATWETIDTGHWNTVIFASATRGWVLGTDGRIGRWLTDGSRVP